ncbi:Histone deacetylase 14 [Hondaea fermentalgiana]|uniref:Histone deacetylase 14 n=1 Tax=Hondaea fermentalgiana TaxID=2315210 RepID=A0A2R5G873_9STRA|nr:Histone deacetylase 14 [Hondaea fermentalgiana]|eukprot:GBG27190.1 Histone deacetylase 14 [Hondaea fermentalgiana]
MAQSDGENGGSAGTGYVFEQLYLWHEPGSVSFDIWTQPGEHWEAAETKHRLHALLEVSGALDDTTRIRAREAKREELLYFHTEAYVDKVAEISARERGGDTGEMARLGNEGWRIAILSCGGVLAAVEAIHAKKVRNAYCLVRPPGHHAEPDQGMGFCIFNNIVIGALHARRLGHRRIAVVDFDIHHGNGTETAAKDDQDFLFISLHQDNNYPIGRGAIIEDEAGQTTINIPLPPGSGVGAYEYAMTQAVLPALRKFDPDFIFVSAGYDGAFCDPLARMMLTSEAFGGMARQIIEVANTMCEGRILFAHEGGYSKEYSPFCGLAVVEALTGHKSKAEDGFLVEANAWAYQALQPSQRAVIDRVASILGFGDALSATESEALAEIEKLLARDGVDREKLLGKLHQSGLV